MFVEYAIHELKELCKDKFDTDRCNQANTPRPRQVSNQRLNPTV
jgi:hypothetical protein